MKLLRHSLFRVLLLSATMFVGVATQASCQSKSKKQTTQEASQPHVMVIDAKYMKEHIYDFEKNPTEFVYKGDKPAIIDFYADWCGPCRQLAPKLERIVAESEGKVLLYKVNVDKDEVLAAHFGVKSIPMVLFVPTKGMPIQTLGNIPEGTINEYIQEIISKSKE
ncbi:thioredoxin domain-containing protein [Porphyromonas endodontalis]|uniref:thioredoxin domain-containing protein n=1 Tax=Porphyromonas endodontalis TaxID=28124 RepID=UPI0028801CDB|nr:thioredoxin domain-containing protein [Porphyromonas endodontalis]